MLAEFQFIFGGILHNQDFEFIRDPGPNERIPVGTSLV
jgi:hypothetical protein